MAITATFAVIIGTALTTTNMAWAADITCTRGPVTPNPCTGTNDPDNMKGTSDDDAMSGLDGDDSMNGFAGNDQMFGGRGDDTMSGGSGHDFMLGREGDDNINGDSGDDTILGFRGADILKGSSGNDRIFHDFLRFPVEPDGSKDSIDCGSGNDEAWINVSQDGDTAVNCEILHTDLNP